MPFNVYFYVFIFYSGSFLTILSPHVLKLYRRMLHPCFAGTLQYCFEDYKTWWLHTVTTEFSFVGELVL